MKVALLGYGVVGKSVVDLIEQIDGVEIKYILVKKSREKTLDIMIDDINLILEDQSIDVVIECIGGTKDALAYVLSSLNSKKHVVTSNKELMAKHYSDLIKCATENMVNIRFEASCGGSVMWFQSIDNIIIIDEIVSFNGIMNGTCNYILSEMQSSNKDFLEVLSNAQRLGYAEADPTFDIEGIDTKFKCCLSANYCFNGSFDYQKIPHFGISNIKKVDIDYAKKANSSIKLVAFGIKIEQQYCLYVIPHMYKQNTPIANINGSLNCLTFNTNLLKSSSFMGRGAGGIPTAFAIMEDVLKINQKHNYNLSNLDNNLELFKMSFYIRSSNISLINQYIASSIDTNVIITKPISIKQLLNIKDILNDQDLFIMGVDEC